MVLLTRLLAATFTTSLLQELLCNELLSIMCCPQLVLRIDVVLYCKLYVVENEIGILNIIRKVIKFLSQLHVLYLIKWAYKRNYNMLKWVFGRMH